MIPEFIEDIIKEIRSSYFANKSPETAAQVIETVKSLQDKGYQESVAILNKVMREAISQTERLDEWNLYAIATREIQSKIEYTFVKNQTVVFNQRKRTIKSVITIKQSVELENGDIVSMQALKEIKADQSNNHSDEQLSLF